MDVQGTWLVTGGAGFIGSHLTQTLLREGQRVVVLDSLVTGYQRNLDDAVKRAGEGAASRFTFASCAATSMLMKPSTFARCVSRGNAMLRGTLPSAA